jgi:hypothetical protein
MELSQNSQVASQTEGEKRDEEKDTLDEESEKDLESESEGKETSKSCEVTHFSLQLFLLIM